MPSKAQVVIAPSPKCPYCDPSVRDNPKAVNGITPVTKGKGCEFCEPLKR